MKNRLIHYKISVSLEEGDRERERERDAWEDEGKMTR